MILVVVVGVVVNQTNTHIQMVKALHLRVHSCLQQCQSRLGGYRGSEYSSVIEGGIEEDGDKTGTMTT